MVLSIEENMEFQKLSVSYIVGLVETSACVLNCLTLCDPMACSLLGSSVPEIFQARILEWVAISYSRGSS